LSPMDSAVYGLRRESSDGQDIILVLVNTDVVNKQTLRLASDWTITSRESLPQSEPVRTEELVSQPAAAPQKTVSTRKPEAANPLLSEQQALGRPLGAVDLLGQDVPKLKADSDGKLVLTLAPAAAYCLSANASPRGPHGEEYRRRRQQAAWAIGALA